MATRRAPHYPRQYMNLQRLIDRIAKRFPYVREITVEDLNPSVYSVSINKPAPRSKG